MEQEQRATSARMAQRITKACGDDPWRRSLLLYGLLAPPFMLILGLATYDEHGLWPLLAVAGICLGAVVLIARKRKPAAYYGVYPAGIAPVLCCAVGLVSTHAVDPVFTGLLGAPIALTAAWFEAPVVVAAWATATACCLWATALDRSIPGALAVTAFFASVHGIAAWTIHHRRKHPGTQSET